MVELVELAILLWIVCTSIVYTFAHVFGFIEFVNPFNKHKKENYGFLEAMNKYKVNGTIREFTDAFSKQKHNKFIGK